MEDYQELEIKVMQMLTDVQLPQEILTKINAIYLQYKQAYSSCIYDLSVMKDEADKDKVIKIKEKITHEYNKYMYKIDQIIEQAMDNKNMQRVRRINDSTLNEREGRVDQDILDKKDNEQFIKSLQTGLAKFLISSRDVILSAMEDKQNSSMKIQENLKEKGTQRKFKEKIERLLEQIESDFPALSQTLDLQDEEIYQKIMQAMQLSKENQKREQFINTIRKDVIVNPEEIKRSMAQQRNKEEEMDESEPSR